MGCEKNIERAHEDIREAGYEFASSIYEDFAKDPEVEQTRECIHECILESACHDLDDALESVGRGGLKYLDWLDWQDVVDVFSKGIHRLIDEKYPDTRRSL